MAFNNDAFYDAVVAGAGGGAQHGWLVLSTPASYTPFATNIDILATAVDLQIPAIAGEPSISQINLLQSITQSILTARFPVPVAPATYIDIAKAIAAVYVELEKLLTNQPTVASYGVNWLVADWYIDGTVGDDANSGVVIGAPLKTGAELLRRLGPYAMWPQSVTVHVLANGMIDALILHGVMLTTGTHLDVIGTETLVLTDSIATYTSLSHVTPSATIVTAATIIDWSPHVGKRLRITSGASVGTIIWIMKADPGGAGVQVAQTTRTSNIDQISALALHNQTNIVPAPGSTFAIETLPIVPAIYVNISTQLVRSNGPQWPLRTFFLSGIDCPQIEYHGSDYQNYARSMIFGCAMGPCNIAMPLNADMAVVRVGCLVKYTEPAEAYPRLNIHGDFFCCGILNMRADIPIMYYANMYYCLFQNSRLVLAAGSALTAQDLQFFDILATGACFSVGVGSAVLASSNMSGTRNAGYGIGISNNTRSRITGTTNLSGALGQAQISSSPAIPVTTAQLLQTTDYTQKGTSAAMVAGTITITVPWYENTIQKVSVSHAAFGGTPGILSVQQISNTQFTITSSSALDTSTVNWTISPLGRNIFISTV